MTFKNLFNNNFLCSKPNNQHVGHFRRVHVETEPIMTFKTFFNDAFFCSKPNNQHMGHFRRVHVETEPLMTFKTLFNNTFLCSKPNNQHVVHFLIKAILTDGVSFNAFPCFCSQGFQYWPSSLFVLFGVVFKILSLNKGVLHL